MHDIYLHSFAALFVIGLAFESIAYFAAPWLLAGVAFIPIGEPRRFKLSPEAREALAAQAAHAGGYRERAARPFDLTRAGLPARFEVPGALARFYPARRFVTVRLPYSMTDKLLVLARIDVIEQDGVVELRARFVPVSAATLLFLCPVGAVGTIVGDGLTSGTFTTLGIGALFLVINLGAGYLFGRRRIGVAAALVAERIEHALTHASAS